MHVFSIKMGPEGIETAPVEIQFNVSIAINIPRQIDTCQCVSFAKILYHKDHKSDILRSWSLAVSPDCFWLTPNMVAVDASFWWLAAESMTHEILPSEHQFRPFGPFGQCFLNRHGRQTRNNFFSIYRLSHAFSLYPLHWWLMHELLILSQ